ncbi:MAG: glycosyltransferase family 4 protein [Bacteroidota bacterium]
MKILFVLSGNSKYHQNMPAFIRSQADSLIEQGINLEIFQIKGKGIFGYLKNIHPLKRVLKSGKYDIIHAHYGFCGVISAIARRKEKLVVSFMGESEFKLDPEDLKRPALLIMMKLHKIFAKYYFDHIIFKSKNLSDFLPKLFYKSSIIPNGVNIDIFKPTNYVEARKHLNINNEEKIILWIGNQSRSVKGFNLAIEIIKSITEILPNTKLLAIDNIPHSKLALYYNASDLFLLSSFSEGSPNVIKEALACNCPIVSTPVGDVLSIIQNTKGCYVSESFNKLELVSLILKCLSNNERSEGAYRIKELKLDTKNKALELINLYNSLINNRK